MKISLKMILYVLIFDPSGQVQNKQLIGHNHKSKELIRKEVSEVKLEKAEKLLVVN